jgi:hypothetical protein
MRLAERMDWKGLNVKYLRCDELRSFVSTSANGGGNNLPRKCLPYKMERMEHSVYTWG